MLKSNWALALVPASCVLLLNTAVLKYPLHTWQEPRLVLSHALVTLAYGFVLQRRFGVLPGTAAALVFGLFPVHAYFWSIGKTGFFLAAAYLAVMALAWAMAAGFFIFWKFLRDQEPIVRGMLMAAVAALVAGLALLTLQLSRPFTDPVTLWRWRVKVAPSADYYLTLAELELRQRSSIEPSKATEISSLFQKALKLNPQKIESYHRLAAFYKRLGGDKEAVAVYRKALTVDARNMDTHIFLFELYERLQAPKKAIEVSNRLLKLFPEDEAVLGALMSAYGRAIAANPRELIYQEKREDLLSKYEQLSKRKKYSAGDYFNLGFLYEQVGGYEEAIRFYRKALELSPNHEKSMFNLANRYGKGGDIKTALALYGRLIKINPKNLHVYLNMGILYNALGETGKARWLYQKVIHIDPANAGAYYYLGYLNEAAGELREALTNYEKAVESDPQHAEAYYNMGNVYATLEQYPEAIASYLKTVAINPNHQNAYVNLSILSFKSKDYAKAVHYLEEAQVLGYNAPDEYLRTLKDYRKK